MSVNYIAAWSDRFTDPTRRCTEIFTAWCDRQRRADPTLRAAVSVTAANTVYDVDLTARFDAHTRNGRRRTTLRVAGPNDPRCLLSIVVTVEHPDQDTPAAVGAPSFVPGLLAAGERPMNAPHRVTAAAQPLHGAAAAEPLAETITAFARQLPLVVLVADRPRSCPFVGRVPGFRAITTTFARAVAGTANVLVVDDELAAAVTDILGTTHGLPTGTGLRVYLPEVDPAVDTDADRHPRIDADDFDRDTTAAMRTTAQVLLDHALSREPVPTLAAA